MSKRLRTRWLVTVTSALVTAGSCLSLATPTAALAAQRVSTVKNLTWDSRTVLLDHFDGSTVGTATGSLSYGRSQPGLGQAGVLGPGRYVKYGLAGSTTNTGTVEMWIRPTSGLTATTGLLNFNWNDTATLPASGWVLQMLISSSATVPPNVLEASTAVGDTSIPLNQWTHVALTWSPTSSKLYLNGALTGSGEGSPPSITNPYWAYLNYWGTTQSGPFSGLVDELRISDIDRSGAEILADATLTGPPRLSYTTFDYPNASFTDVAGVNANGVIAGYFGDATGQHGFIATPKKPKGTTNVAFDVPDATGLVVTSINDQGTVTGAFWTGDTQHGFLRAADGTFTWLDDPAVQGTVVGNAVNGCAPVWNVFVMTNGIYTLVDSYNPPGSAGAATTVTSINDNGVVGGSWRSWTSSPTGPVFGPDHGLVAQLH